MKSILKNIFLHLVFFTLGTFLFIILFRLFSNINVLFYRGIVLLFLSCIILLLFMVFLKRTVYGKFFTYKDIILSIVLIFCLNLLFFTHLPVTAERSISVFLLGYMNKYSNRAFTNKEISKIFKEKYVDDFHETDKRLSEQLISKNIASENNTYKITNQGKLIIKLYSLIADIFNINKQLISP